MPLSFQGPNRKSSPISARVSRLPNFLWRFPFSTKRESKLFIAPEICLLAKVKRTASVRAESYCDLYSLQAVDFLGVLAEFPLMRARMEQLARIRLSELGRSSSLIRNT